MLKIVMQVSCYMIIFFFLLLLFPTMVSTHIVTCFFNLNNMFDLLIYNILSIRKMNRSLVGLDLELSSICRNFTAIYY